MYAPSTVFFLLVIDDHLTNKLRVRHVKELMTRGPATPKTATAVNLLQLLLRQHANQASPNTGRAYFSPQGKQQLQGLAVELWRGFYQSVRPTIGKMLVTVDTTVATMYVIPFVLTKHSITRVFLL
jgi:eukaryotic translation initiation factor 2C